MGLPGVVVGAGVVVVVVLTVVPSDVVVCADVEGIVGVVDDTVLVEGVLVLRVVIDSVK